MFVCNNKEDFMQCFSNFPSKISLLFKEKHWHCVVAWYKEYKKRKPNNLPELLSATSSSKEKKKNCCHY